jgi:CMP-2-keto-3-deoxyoctulosonic acid synthetase
MGELAPVVNARLESVAVNVQGDIPAVKTTALKVATPAAATSLVVPVRVQADVMAMVSVALTPPVITLPYESSVATVNVDRSVPARAGDVG